MNVGIARFNFTFDLPDQTIHSLKQLILNHLAGSGIDVAANTFSLYVEGAQPPDPGIPPLPGFNQIRGTIRRP